jgi:restriction endonuclease S subunit
LINGDYPVIGGGQKPLGYHNEYNVVENTILISKIGAYAGYISKYNSKIFVSNNGIYIDKIDDTILKDYIYYYLKSIQNKIYQLQLGTAQPGIKKEQLELLKIPIPSIEKQEELVKRIDIFENANKDIIKLIENLNKFNKIKLESLFNKNIEFIEFGQMFDLIKGSIQSSKVVEDPDGDSVFINLSKNKDFKKINTYELDYENIFISNVSPLGLIQYYNGKCSYSNLLYHIKIKDNFKDKINIKYIYYYLLEKQNYIEENYQKGCANKSLDVEEFNLMKIPIPSIEIQEEIIEYCDNNIKIIENLNKTIEGNKKIIKDIITSI